MIRIITDSTCEARPEILAHPAVSVVPLSVCFGSESLRDGIEITRQEFWQRLPKSNPLPTTSQANPGDFIGIFEEAQARGDEVVVIVLSAKLSGTHSSAVTAQAMHADWPIDVVDSQSVSVGLGLMVAEALNMAQSGATRGQIVARMESMREKVHLAFVLETLEYLEKGGRIGKAQAFVGTLLKFKPILGIVGGEVMPLLRVRSRAKALEAVQELMLERVPARSAKVQLGITHAQVPDEAAKVAGDLSRRFGTQNVYCADLGPVLGVHVGPGTIGVATYSGE